MKTNSSAKYLILMFLIGMGAGYFLSTRSSAERTSREIASNEDAATRQHLRNAEVIVPASTSGSDGGRSIASVNPEQELFAQLESLPLNVSREICHRASQSRLARIMDPFERKQNSSEPARTAIRQTVETSKYWYSEYSIPISPAQRVNVLLKFHPKDETEQVSSASEMCWTLTIYTASGLSGMGGCGVSFKDGVPYINFETTSKTLSPSISALAYALPPVQTALYYDNNKDAWLPSPHFIWSEASASDFESREKQLADQNGN